MSKCMVCGKDGSERDPVVVFIETDLSHICRGNPYSVGRYSVVLQNIGKLDTGYMEACGICGASCHSNPDCIDTGFCRDEGLQSNP